MNPLYSRLASLAVPAVLLLAYFVYAPGLSGTFLFDDYATLPALSNHGGVEDWRRAALFVFGGQTGPTGRPVALASFLLNATHWPAPSASPFLYTNILLHLFTGALLMWLAFKLARALGRREYEAAWIAVLTGGLWLLHPFWVSTTLYVVQRMTILAALFMVAGLLAYTQARFFLARREEARAVGLLLLGIAGFGSLAILSKENGALLPLMALTLDITVLRQLEIPAHAKRRWQIWHSLIIKLPSAAVAGYLLWILPGVIQASSRYREFSLAERLLTQPRVLFDYLFNIFLPRIHAGGLYHDHFIISDSLLSPPLTLFAILGILALIVLGFVLRKTYPVIAAAILFFFAGHLLESTVIPLELYFEHRNYFPAMLIFFAAAAGIVALTQRYRVVGTTAILTFVISLAALTYARASLWGSPAELALVWAQENPASERAQTEAALLLSDAGYRQRALWRVETGLEHNPDSISLNLQRRSLQCRLGIAKSRPPEQLLHALRAGDYSFTTYRGLRSHLFLVNGGYCGAFVGVPEVINLVDAALDNPDVARSAGAQSNLAFLKGQAYLLMENTGAAKRAFDQAMRLDPEAGLGLRQAALLASANQFEAAMSMLNKAEIALQTQSKETIIQEALQLKESYYASEIARLRQLIRAEASGD